MGFCLDEGQPPRTKNRFFQFGLMLSSQHTAQQQRKKEKSFVTTNTMRLTIPSFTGGVGLADPKQKSRAGKGRVKAH